MTPSRFFNRVVEAAPSFEAIRLDCLSYNGELLPHVLMADLLRYLQSHYSGEALYAAMPPTETELASILALIDEGLSVGDSHVRNAIEVSFVEGIESEPYFGQLSRLIGPAVRKELARQQAWWKEYKGEAGGQGDAR